MWFLSEKTEMEREEDLGGYGIRRNKEEELLRREEKSLLTHQLEMASCLALLAKSR